MAAKIIDDLSNPGVVNFSAVIDGVFGKDFTQTYGSEKSDFNFQPNNTKEILHTFFQDMYANIDLPCGSSYSTTTPTFELTNETENSLGKAIAMKYAAGVISLNGLNDKRCALDSKLSQF